MSNLEKYRLTNYSFIEEYEKKMGIDYFRKYRDDIYRFLVSMKIGDRFSIERNVKVENIDLFIKIVCMFILAGNTAYEFSNDYKFVIRNAK